MAAQSHYTSAPTSGVKNGDLFSDKTEAVSLASSDWEPTADTGDTTRARCPRAFVPSADGLLAYRAVSDSANRKIYVLKGLQYPIAIKFVDQSECAAALQVADALCLLY